MIYYDFIQNRRQYRQYNNNVLRTFLNVAVIDLDGTLFDDSKRRHYLGKRDYASYQKNCVSDTLRTDIVQRILKYKYDAYLIASGRLAQYTPITLSMLPSEIVGRLVGIGMREDGELLGNVDIKKKTLIKFMDSIEEHSWLYYGDVFIDWWDDNPDCFEGRWADDIARENFHFNNFFLVNR